MMTTGTDRLFLDTNILVYLTNGLSPWNIVATETVEAAQQANVELVISTQCLREYLAVATRPDAQGQTLPTADILANYQLFQAEFVIVEDSLAVTNALANLLETIGMVGRQVYDTNIVATMQTYGISRLLTNNEADFTRYANLITVVPLVSQVSS